MRTAFFSIVVSDGQLLANQGTLHVGLGHAQAHDEVHFAGLAGLADFQVAAQGHVQVGVGGIPAGSGSHQALHLHAGVAQGFFIAGGAGHGVPGVGGLQHGPFQRAVLDDAHAGDDGTVDLQTGAAQFAVTHDGVHVAHLHQTTFHAHGEVGGVALDHQLAVQVAAVAAGVAARHALALFGGHADDADHGIDGEGHVIEDGLAVLDGDALGAGLALVPEGADLGQGGGGTDGVALHVQQFHLDDVAGLGVAHEQRAGGGVHLAVVAAGHQLAFGMHLVAEAVLGAEDDDLAGIDGAGGFVVGTEGINDLVKVLHDSTPAMKVTPYRSCGRLRGRPCSPCF